MIKPNDALYNTEKGLGINCLYLLANKYFTFAVVHVMCQSRRRGRGLHVIKGKGMLVVKKLESNRPWIPIWAWFSEQLSCTRVMAFSPTSVSQVKVQ